MKLFVTLTLPLLWQFVSAGYFSQGWSPDEAATATAAIDPTQTETPAVPTPTKLGFKFPSLDLESFLTSGPIASAIAKSGVNVTERLAEAKKRAAETGWDERVPLITDDNFQEMIVEEPLTPEELEKRVWFLVISMPSRDPISKFVDAKYDEAFNITHSAPEKALPHVKWGRINYVDVTRITTRWFVWKAPVLVVLRDRGQSLRFYTPREIRLQPDILHEFLKVNGWNETPEWSGVFSPRGSWGENMNKFSDWSGIVYRYLDALPRWVFLLVSGGLASFLVNWFHKPAPPPPRVSTAKLVKMAHDAKLSRDSAPDNVQPTPASSTTPSPSKRRGKGKGKT